jgi:hypothetical protein
MARFLSTTTPLIGGASLPTPLGPIQPEAGDNIVGIVFADVAGTLFVDQSADGGQNWDMVTSIAVAAGVGQGFSVPVYGNAVQIRYTNGAGAQSAFRLRAKISSAGPRA